MYGSATSVRINNNSAYITGYAAVEEPKEEYGYYSGGESTKQKEDGTYTINYLNQGSTIASTTRNKSGVYDMSGGASEISLSFSEDDTNTIIVCSTNDSNMGMNGKCADGSIIQNGTSLPEQKYYDLYIYGINQNVYSRRILGDAIGETGPFNMGTMNKRYINSWYQNDSWLIFPRYPVLTRGGTLFYGKNAGTFASSIEPRGLGSASEGFRIVLAP